MDAGYKTIFVGESDVGKTSIIKWLCKNEFSHFRNPTVGGAYQTYRHFRDDGSTQRFDIWDTAGQERFHALIPMYFRDIVLVIMVYDATLPETFDRIVSYWHRLVLKESKGNPLIILVGNKIDLEYDADLAKRAEQYAYDNDMVFAQTSACQGTNIRWMFDMIRTELDLRKKKQELKANKGKIVELESINYTESPAEDTGTSKCMPIKVCNIM